MSSYPLWGKKKHQWRILADSHYNGAWCTHNVDCYCSINIPGRRNKASELIVSRIFGHSFWPSLLLLGPWPRPCAIASGYVSLAMAFGDGLDHGHRLCQHPSTHMNIAPLCAASKIKVRRKALFSGASEERFRRVSGLQIQLFWSKTHFFKKS